MRFDLFSLLSPRGFPSMPVRCRTPGHQGKLYTTLPGQLSLVELLGWKNYSASRPPPPLRLASALRA